MKPDVTEQSNPWKWEATVPQTDHAMHGLWSKAAQTAESARETWQCRKLHIRQRSGRKGTDWRDKRGLPKPSGRKIEDARNLLSSQKHHTCKRSRLKKISSSSWLLMDLKINITKSRLWEHSWEYIYYNTIKKEWELICSRKRLKNHSVSIKKKKGMKKSDKRVPPGPDTTKILKN